MPNQRSLSSTSQEVFKLPIFEGKNYSSWSEKMKSFFESDKDKLWDIVQNGYVRPKDATELASWGDAEKKKYRDNEKRDAKASLFIQQAVSDNIMTEVFTSEEARDIFKKNRIQAPGEDEAFERYTGEAIRDRQMMESMATSHDVWEILETLYESSPGSNKDKDLPNKEEIFTAPTDSCVPHGENFFYSRKLYFNRWFKMWFFYYIDYYENQVIPFGGPEKWKTITDAEIEMQMDIYEKGVEEVTRSSLFRLAMKGDWKKVTEIYTRKAVAHCAKITNSGDTALHLAVIDGQEETVDQLVKLMSLEEATAALKVQNEHGNTPLHLAASVGNVNWCDCIVKKVYSPVKKDQNSSEKKEEVEKDQKSKAKEVEKDQKSERKEVENDQDSEAKDYLLLGERNKDNETPLFLAASLGKTDAFLCLHKCALPGNRKSYYRGKNGDTILHVAISGEYFDLAFQIIHLDREVVDMVNERGMLPLHCLASRPTAFRSGSHLPPYDKCIYHCTIVAKLVKDKGGRMQSRFGNGATQNENNDCCPENYNTCFDFFSWVKRLFWAPMGLELPITCAKEQKGEADKQSPAATQASHDTNPIQTLFSWLKKTFEAGKETKRSISARGRWIPPNYGTIFALLKLVLKTILVILGLGSMQIRKIQLKKEKHTWSLQVLDLLLDKASLYKYESTGNSGRDPHRPSSLSEASFGPEGSPAGSLISLAGKDEAPKMEKLETPILMAAKNGITEIMEKILDKFPVAIHDINSQKKNVVLLAVENRQPHVYRLLLDRRKKNRIQDRIFRQVDDKGNSARHLAASIVGGYKPWRIPGAALQIQWEIKWYKYVKNSMPQNFFARLNSEHKSPKEIFNRSHQGLVKSGGEWLTNTSQSCSVVAALIATVAFATSATVPGGNDDKSGSPILENQVLFQVFAVSSLVALCFSVTSMVMFLSILTSRYEAKDFGEDLPTKLLLGLTSLFVSIAAILVCFCAGHFFVLSKELKYAALPVYGVTCLPVTFFAIAQLPLYLDLVRATFATVPQRRYVVVADEKDISSAKSDGTNKLPGDQSPQNQGTGSKTSTNQPTGGESSSNQETNPGTQSKT